MEMMAKTKTGFTLIEILVTLATLGIVVGIVVSTFLVTLTKSAKVKMVEAVESDGEYALRTIGRLLRGGKRAVLNSQGQACQADMNYIRVENPNGEWLEFGCLNEGLGESFIASYSATRSQRLTSPRVKLDNCQFNCFPGGVDQPDRVEIVFTLSQSELSLRVEEQALIDFQTMVTLRNY
jgi:prepilin-type N-terminal cleavage/methylation domain-containing protein